MTDNQADIHPLSKLLKKGTAVFALSVIAITSLIAIFAYVLAPDNTPNANRMIIELSAKAPGFSRQLLKVPLPTVPERKSFLHELFNGTPSAYSFVPINGYSIKGDKMLAYHYIDDDIQDTISYSIASLAINSGGKELKEQITFIEKELIHQATFYLGTDRYGRDILSRLLIGSRVSIAVGFIAVLLSITIGIILGALSGYFGGITDNFVMWLINILWAIPTLLLVFAITLTIGKGFWQIFIAIGLTMWVSAARLIRGQVMSVKEMEYVTAARALGYSSSRIIFKHILPNIAGPVMVVAASNFATAILIEAGLSFLGIGVQPPMPSWGLMIKEHYNFLLTNRPLLAIIPGLGIMLLVYAFNLLGNALRDVLDVRN